MLAIMYLRSTLRLRSNGIINTVGLNLVSLQWIGSLQIGPIRLFFFLFTASTDRTTFGNDALMFLFHGNYSIKYCSFYFIFFIYSEICVIGLYVFVSRFLSRLSASPIWSLMWICVITYFRRDGG